MKGAPILLLGGLAAVGALLYMRSSSASSSEGSGGTDPLPVAPDECAAKKAAIDAMANAELGKMQALCLGVPTGDNPCTAIAEAVKQASPLRGTLEGCDFMAPTPECSANLAKLQAVLQTFIPKLVKNCSGNPTDPICAELLQFGGKAQMLSADWMLHCAKIPVPKVPVPIGASIQQENADALSKAGENIVQFVVQGSL